MASDAHGGKALKVASQNEGLWNEYQVSPETSWKSAGLNRLFEELRRNEPLCPFLQRVCDNARLRADEIAAGLLEVRPFDHRQDALDPMRRDPSWDVVSIEKP